MVDAGAVEGLSFDDAGVVSTDERAVLPVARAILNELARSARPDVIVAELGDGILGEYGVGVLLAEKALMRLSAALVVCAPDQVGAWGASRVLDERFGLSPSVITGPATDTDVGRRFIVDELGLPAHNARRDAESLVARITECLDARA